MTNWEMAQQHFEAGETFSGAKRYSIGTRAGQPVSGYREVINLDGKLSIVEYSATHVDGLPLGTRYKIIESK